MHDIGCLFSVIPLSNKDVESLCVRIMKHRLAMLRRMHELVQQGSQFIIATHSPLLMAYPNAKIISLDHASMTEVGYEDTEHYSMTKYFLNNYHSMLEKLLKPE